jgi:hypothetical protein
MILASQLRPPVRHVALTLSTHMSARGDSCFPSLTTLEAETGLARKTIWRALDELEGAGLLQRQRTPGRSTRYRALGAQGTYPLGDESTQLGAQGNQLGASGHPEDVQEDVHEDVKPSTRADARSRKKGATGARRKKKTGSDEWEGIEAYDRV